MLPKYGIIQLGPPPNFEPIFVPMQLGLGSVQTRSPSNQKIIQNQTSSFHLKHQNLSSNKTDPSPHAIWLEKMTRENQIPPIIRELDSDSESKSDLEFESYQPSYSYDTQPSKVIYPSYQSNLHMVQQIQPKQPIVQFQQYVQPNTQYQQLVHPTIKYQYPTQPTNQYQQLQPEIQK